jgi:hypothetical protein
MELANASWRFVLARSYDLLPLGELMNARGRTISLKLNDPGSASFNISMDDDVGYQIMPHQHALMAYRKGSTGLKLIWSGYVNTIEEDIANRRMTVNCTGWLSRFSKRIVHKDYVFSATDDGDIIGNLFYEASLPGISYPSATIEFGSGTSTATHPDGLVARWPPGSRPNTSSMLKWGGKVPNEGVGGATAYVAVTAPSMGSAGRNITYLKYQANVLQAMLDLTNMENGCDIYVDPATRVFYVFRKRQKILPGVVFGYGWGPENISSITRQLDGSTVVNWLLAIGGSATTPQPAKDDASMAAYGLVEEVVSLSDLTGQSANNSLGYYASAEVAIRSTPRQIYSFTPFNWHPEGSVPEPFVDYDIGDLVNLGVVSKPRINTKLNVRIFGMSFAI